MARQRAQPSVQTAFQPSIQAASPLQTASEDEAVHNGRPKKRGADELGVNTGSQQVSSVPHLLKKPKRDEKQIKQFRAQVATDQRELKGLVQQQMKEAENKDAYYRKEVIDVLRKAFKSPNKRNLPLALPCLSGTYLQSNPPFNALNDMESKCAQLVAEYHVFEFLIEQMASEQKNSVTDTWTKDVEDAERLLTIGHNSAVKTVKAVLGVEVGEDGQFGEVQEGDDVGQAPANLELHKSLQYAERGVKRMVKGLPKDESE